MLARLWSIPLEGDAMAASLLVTRSGRIILSTTRRVAEPAPDGLSHITKIDDESTTYINDYPHRCHAIDPGGVVAWTLTGVYARGEDPDGMLRATSDRHELLVLDRDGIELPRSEVDSRPILTANEGDLWVEPFIYRLIEHHLHRLDRAGELLSKVEIPRQPFEAWYRGRPELAGYPDCFRFPERFDLHYDVHRHRFIATHWSLLAWIMSLDLDGRVEWVTLAGNECCNSTCFAGDAVIVHTSSCGGRVSFLSGDGNVFRSHLVDGVHHALPDGSGGVCAIAESSIHAFDEQGEPRWMVEVPDRGVVAVQDRTLYMVTGRRSNLELSAFQIT